MSASEILKFFVSDILTASIISGIFLWISQKDEKKQKELEEQSLQDLKDHLDLRLEIQTLEIQKYILECLNAKEL